MNHQPIVFPGDAKKDGETDVQHQVRMANNAKARAYHATQREKRLASEAREKAIRNAGVPRAPGPLLGEVKEVVPIRGFELPAEEVPILSPPTIVAEEERRVLIAKIEDLRYELMSSVSASVYKDVKDALAQEKAAHKEMAEEMMQKIDRLHSRLNAIKNYTSAI